MFDGIFSGWHIAILLVVVLLLFGAKRLPGAAQSLGQSMHIFRRSVKGMDEEPPPAGGTYSAQVITPPAAPATPVAPAAPVTDSSAQQIADLQRQLDDLKGNGAAAPAPRPQQ